MAASFKLGPQDLIPFQAAELDTILNWLDSRDLHFGHSAFYALEQLLKDAGKTLTIQDIARDAIVIDILTGVLHPMVTGDLELSLFALKKVAEKNGVALNAAKVNLAELKRQLAAGSKGILVHVSGNHYVVVTKIEPVQKFDENGEAILDESGQPVMMDQVTYQEKNVGPAGVHIQLSMEAFLGLWAVTPNQEGVVLTPSDLEASAKTLSDEETKQITGAFFVEILGFIGYLLYGIASALVIIATAVIQTVVFVVSAIAELVGHAIASIAYRVLEIGKSLVNFGKLFFSGVRFVSENLLRGISSGFSFLKETVSHFGKLLTFPGGPKFTAGALTPSQLVTRQVVGVAASLGSGKLLDKLGVSPTLSRLSNAFITGGIVGLTGGVLGMTGSGSTFLGGALQSLAVAGVNELAMHLDLPPPLRTSLSLISGKLAGSISDPSTLPEAFQSIVPTLVEEFAISGITGLGSQLGLDYRILSLASAPIRASISGLTKGLLNPHVGILDSIKDSLFNSETLKGVISLGTSIGLDAIDAPPILQNFIPGILNQLVAGATGSTGGGGPGSNLFGKITDTLSRFGRGIVLAGQQIISFGTKVIEGIGTLTKTGFAKAVDFFSGIFDRQTQETLIQAGNGSIEQALENNCSVLRDGIQCAYQDIEIIYSSSNDRLSYTNRSTQRTFEGLNQVGNFFGGSIAFAEEADGIIIDGRQDSLNSNDYNLKISSEEHPYSEFNLKVSEGEIKEFFEIREANIKSELRIIGINEESLKRPELDDIRQVSERDLLTGAITSHLISKNSNQTINFNDLGTWLSQSATQLRETTERLMNNLADLGPKTNAELAAHKQTEVQKILDNPDEIFAIHMNANEFVIPTAIRRLSHNETGGITVNHSALVFNQNGNLYVAELGLDGLRMKELDDFLLSAKDVFVQQLPYSEAEKIELIQGQLFKNYYDEITHKPTKDIEYDLKALVEGIAGKDLFPDNSKNVCSNFLAEIFDAADKSDFKWQSLDGDGFVDPTELKILTEKRWEKR